MFRSVVTGGLGLALFLCVSVDKESPNEFMDNLGALGRKPDWSRVTGVFQEGAALTSRY